MSRYASLMDVSDGTPIEAKVAAYLNAQVWPGFPKYPGNPYPNEVKNVNSYFPSLKPVPSPGGRVLRKNQRYVFLSNYNTYP